MKIMKTKLQLLCLLLATGWPAGAFAAATVRHWDGSSSGSWTTAANWSNNVAPVAGDALIFLSTAQNKTNSNNFPAGTAFGQIRLADDCVINGNAMTLTNGLVLGAPLVGAANATVNTPLTLLRDQAFTANGGLGRSSYLTIRSTVNLNGNALTVDGGGTVELAGNISGAGSGSDIIKHGAGTLIISNATLAGQVAVLEGTFRLNGTMTDAGVFVDSTGLWVGSGTVGGAVTIQGPVSPGVNGPGRLTLNSNLTFFNNNLFIAQINGTNAGVEYDQIRVRGVVTGGAPAAIQLSIGYAAHVGDRFILVDNQGSQPVSVSYYFAGEASPCNFPSFITTNGYSFLLSTTGGDGNDVEVTVVGEPGSPINYWVPQDNAARGLWSSGLNWITGAAPDPGDHLHFTSLGCIGFPIGITNDLPAGTSFGSLSLVGQVSLPYSLSIFGNALRLTTGLTNTAPVVTNTIYLPMELVATQAVHCAAAPLQLGGVVSGVGGLIKTGPGEVRVMNVGINSYSGGTVVNEGTLRLSRFGVAVPGPLTIGDGTGTDTVLTDFANQFPASTLVTINSSGLLDLQGQLHTVSGLTLNGGRLQTGGGTLTLGGNVTAGASPVQASVAGRLDLLGSVIGFTVADGPLPEDLFVSAALTNGAVNKLGAGTLVLAGANTFTGTTTVNAGRLRVTGVHRLSTTTVNGGSVLDGTGLLGPTIVTTGTIAPGTNVGLLRMSGDLTLSAGATFFVELNGLIAGTAHDQLSVTGAVNLAGATLAGTVGFASTPGNTFTILLNDGADAITGTFAGLPEGAVFPLGGQFFSISYHAGTGNDVVLTRVNAPAQFGGLTRQPGGQMQLQGTGEPGLSYVVQGNTNLNFTNDWLNLGTVPANGAGLFQFLDTNAPQHPRRFYRALTQ